MALRMETFKGLWGARGTRAQKRLESSAGSMEQAYGRYCNFYENG